MRRLVAALLGAFLFVLGGCQTTGRTVDMPSAQPPLAELTAPPTFLTPRSQRYRVAVQPFVDQTGRATALADAAADVLVTALHDERRFSLYDGGRELTLAIRSPRQRPAGPAASAAPAKGPAPAAVSLLESDPELEGMVDGVLESNVTALQLDANGNGSFEVDYRMVDPYSRMVVTSGSARMGVRSGAPVRKDFQKLASALAARFLDPARMADRTVSVSEVNLSGGEVKLTLDGGLAAEVARGAVGFVVEQDRVTHVDRYLAKFVVVTVFEEAAVGVVVEHCNAVGRCAQGEAVPAVRQARNVHVGSQVRFK